MAQGQWNPFYNYWLPVTPSDTVNIVPPPDRVPPVTSALYVGGAGDIVAVRQDGTAVTFKAAIAGTIIPIGVIRVNATSTTATNLVALYAV